MTEKEQKDRELLIAAIMRELENAPMRDICFVYSYLMA